MRRIGNNINYHELVHELNHVVLDIQVDRMQMWDAIKAGTTFTMVQNQKTKDIVALAAMTVSFLKN